MSESNPVPDRRELYERVNGTPPPYPLDSRIEDARLWLHEMFGHQDADGEGNVLLALCDLDGEWDELKPFRVDRPPWDGVVPDHATMLDMLAASVVKASATNDVYACPYLHARRRRESDGAVLREHVHADIDGPLDLTRVRFVGGFAVASGSEGPRGHAYVRLSESVEPHVHRALNRALGQMVGGDDHDTGKVGDADVLRPAGTLNHKTDPPRPVTWLIRPDADGVVTWEPEDLARVLHVPWPVPITDPDPDPEPVEPLSLTPELIQARLDGLVRLVVDAEPGDGNNALRGAARIAGALSVTEPVDEETMRQRLVAAFLERPIPPGETEQGRRREAKATFRSCWNYGLAHPEAARTRSAPSMGVVSEPQPDAPLVPALPPDIERCPEHGLTMHHDCVSCLGMREQATRYHRNRAVALESQALTSDDAWRAVNLMDAPALADPTIMVAEGVEGADEPLPLIRRGMIAAAHGKSGSGKTTLSYLTGQQVIRNGELFLIVDHEMGQELAREALLDLGLTGAEIEEFVIFFDDPPAVTDLYFERLAETVQDRIDATGYPLGLGVYDSLSRSMGKVPGWSTNDEINVNAWYDSLPRRVLKQFPGSTHLIVDHPGRSDSEEAIGSHAKKAGPDFSLHVRQVTSFDYFKGQGRSVLLVAKARGVRTYPLNTDVSELIVVERKVRLRRLKVAEPKPDEMQIDLSQAAGWAFTKKPSDREILVELAEKGPTVQVDFTGRGDARPYRKAALERLREAGLADWEPGGRGNTGHVWSVTEKGREELSR